MKPIAIIPARGGSQRILRKNIKPLAGKPVIGYAIEGALNSGIFDRVIVTTDDLEIAEVSRQFGAEVPFLRSASLSDNFTNTIEVIADCVERLESLGEVADLVCCIYPVTPLLKFHRIKQGIELLQEENLDYVFSAIEFSSPIQRAFTRNNEGRVEFLFPEHQFARSQDLQKTYHDAGQFYCGLKNAWSTRKPILAGNSSFIELDKYETLDVDDIKDWEFVSSIMKLRDKSD